MWWLLSIPFYISIAALGIASVHLHLQKKKTQRMIDNSLNKLDDKIAENQQVINNNWKKLETLQPSPPKPICRQARKIKIDGIVYESIIVDGEEYVKLGLYHKALEAFFDK